jgi:hypothetical protein
VRRGASRPAVIYEVVPEAEAIFSRAWLLEASGALNEVERLNGGYVIRGHGCLLSAAVHGRPEVCRAFESLLAELVEVPVRECCERGERPRCCFGIMAPSATDAPPPLEP